jgi:peroxiredoxin Q/BCP
MEKGDHVDDFELRDETGTPRKLSEFLAKGPVVLFFYPAALTFGCTRESCHFRDIGAEFTAAGAQRIGISTDPVDKQKKFSEKHSFDYPLLADVEGTVSRMFGVQRKGGRAKRETFVIAPDGTVLEVIKSELRFNVHADRALEVLQAPSS